MKHLITPAVLLLAFAACAADVGRVIVRQQWPWSTAIKVEFELSNVTDPVDISLKAYNGTAQYDQALVDAATSGSRFALSKGGVYTVTLDPSVLFASGTKTVPDFKVTVTATAAEKTAEVLYKIVNLESPYDVTDVTRGALLNGKYGAIETKYSDLDPAFKNVQPADMLIWTGVTNNPAYKTTHLVLRKINSAGTTVKFQNKCNTSFTYDFFIGVFEVTQAQFAKVCSHPRGSNERNPDYADFRPVDRIGWDDIRGKNTGDLWPAGDHTSLDSGKFLYILQQRTGLMIDLPTEAAWEFACRGGNFNQSAPELYTGEYSGDVTCGKIMRCRGINCVNTGSDASSNCDLTDGPAWVGSYLPNAYGLYDMQGNVWEICLDHIGGVPSSGTVVDFRGSAESTWSNKRDRVLRGGSYKSARNTVLIYSSETNHHPTEYPNDCGFRLCLYPDAQPQPQE